MNNKGSGSDRRNARERGVLQSGRNKRNRQLEFRPEVEEEMEYSPPMGAPTIPSPDSSFLQYARGSRRGGFFSGSSSSNVAGTSGRNEEEEDEDENEDEEDENEDEEDDEEENEPRAPEDTTLIPSYADHVAYQLLNEKERGCLVGHHRNNTVKTWKIASGGAAPLVARSGLAHLPDIMYDGIDMALVSAIVERWNPETNSFHMPWGEMNLLLHDVAHILGLPVDGNPIVLTVEGHPDAIEEMLATALGIGQVKDVREAVGWLSSNCKSTRMRALAEDPDCPAQRKARIYLWWVVTQTLFVDKSKTHGHASFIELLREPAKAGQSCWAAGALAFLYRELGMASRKEAMGIGGCLTLLQAWIYHYFPRFRPAASSSWREGDPMASMYIAPKRNAEDQDRLLVSYRRQLDNMSAENVEWAPFGGHPGRRFPKSMYRGLIHCRGIQEAYMPDRCVRQFGYIQNIPRSPIMPRVARRPVNPRKYVVKHDPALWIWAEGQPAAAFLHLDTAQVSSDCTSDYLHWYMQRTYTNLSDDPEASPDNHERGWLYVDPQQSLQRIAGYANPFHRSTYFGTHNPESEALRNITDECERMMPFLNLGRPNRRG